METTGFAELARDLRICAPCTEYFQRRFPTAARAPAADAPPGLAPNTTFKLTALVAEACPSCLGVCQLVNDPAFLAYVRASIKDAGFEFDGFNVNFRLPLSLKLRQKYFQLLLTKALADKGLDCPREVFDFDLKSTIKNILNLEIGALIGVEASSSEDFVISLEFNNPDDELEFVG